MVKFPDIPVKYYYQPDARYARKPKTIFSHHRFHREHREKAFIFLFSVVEALEVYTPEFLVFYYRLSGERY